MYLPPLPASHGTAEVRYTAGGVTHVCVCVFCQSRRAGGVAVGSGGGGGGGGNSVQVQGAGVWAQLGEVRFSLAEALTLGPQAMAAAAEAVREAERERLRAAEERRVRAEARLLAWLDEAQVRAYRAFRCFDVTASDGSRWRIQCVGMTGNCILLDRAGAPHRAFCAHPYAVIPEEAWLAQALALRTDVRAFLAVANPYGTFGANILEA